MEDPSVLSLLTTISGINLEFTRLLLEGGANVVLADLHLRPEANRLIEQFEHNTMFEKTDVTVWSDLNNMFEAAQRRFGSIDIVCPGAGIFKPHWSNFWCPPGTQKAQDDHLGGTYKSLDINLTHPIRVTQLAISHFLAASPPSSASNPKSIVHISSVAGQTASLLFPLYHIAKHGVQILVRSLEDLDPLLGIRVTAVMPGVVKTPMWTEEPEKLKIVRQEGEGADTWVTSQTVAEVMLACVTSNEISSVLGSATEGDMIPIRGGTCLEILKGGLRSVPLLNNIGPFVEGKGGASLSDAVKLVEEIHGELKPGWGN